MAPPGPEIMTAIVIGTALATAPWPVLTLAGCISTLLVLGSVAVVLWWLGV